MLRLVETFAPGAFEPDDLRILSSSFDPEEEIKSVGMTTRSFQSAVRCRMAAERVPSSR
jgi:hypothetical protein